MLLHEVTAQSRLRRTGARAGCLSNECHVHMKTNNDKTRGKGRSNGNKSGSGRLQSAGSCMTNLEHDQLLLTAPEVGFEVTIALVCS